MIERRRFSCQRRPIRLFTNGALSMTRECLAEMHTPAEDELLTTLSPEPHASRLAETKAKQNSKIQELAGALADAGYRSLDERARILDLPRSTTWSVLKGQHKSSGLSASVIIRMLSAPHLPTNVRTKILEYVTEKAAGRYGNTQARLRQFNGRLSDLVSPDRTSAKSTNTE